MTSITERLGTYGIWARQSDLDEDFARVVEDHGFGALWIGGSPPEDLQLADRLLGATRSIVVATGITNIWNTDPATVAARSLELEAKYPDRFLLGVGVGHREATAEYRRPMEAITEYLDVLDNSGLGADRRILAALGPRMLELSRERSTGAHPYLTTPEHTAEARKILGDGPVLAPEQKVVIEEDPQRARAIARPSVDQPYLHLKNYTDNLRRLGYTDADFANQGSDALIDRLALHGDAPAVASALREHLRAGADHVVVQLLTAEPQDRRGALGALATALGVCQVD
ncbi:TIGR03620 family F420-dependent LLM class oxidoreductase [Epidermidibacterium keratini]|uniref:TIGR03620 family F420-dependent LLM class oxidoreductase n=1 Tax=Epidermidibacterium keratini TaxID=1891644 RepID=A0A7L4YRS5_9ACTN|nr:LLM class F420-dependent oxidoreductase [Epidermidibacterium keratini]QHC01856.1 TIGR03620 family F420-dependent LLM class oxidoreductase [Epidermidibacterium keratini]